MKNQVTCDECEKEFIIVDKKRKHPNGIEENYFTCPYCSYEYTFLVTDAPLRKEQAAIKKLHDQYIKRKSKAMIRSDELKEQLNTEKIVNSAMNAVDEALDDWGTVE